MSRIGKEPVTLAEGVTCTVAGQKVTVKGKLGELSYEMHEGISAQVEGGKVGVERKDDTYKAHDGMGLAVVSTSKGVMSGKEAKAAKLGGELICTVW